MIFPELLIRIFLLLSLRRTANLSEPLKTATVSFSSTSEETAHRRLPTLLRRMIVLTNSTAYAFPKLCMPVCSNMTATYISRRISLSLLRSSEILWESFLQIKASHSLLFLRHRSSDMLRIFSTATVLPNSTKISKNILKFFRMSSLSSSAPG